MNLSAHFTLDELVRSQTAARMGIDNTPSAAIIDNLRLACVGLEKVRHILGDNPLQISSGYRCPDLNRAIGGVPNSAHAQGFAIDFTCDAYGTPFAIAKRLSQYYAELRFDQLIYEFQDWVHIAFDPRARGDTLSIHKGSGYVNGIVGP
jgi:zinc D-Ala-D-Ala carboxypeptidase